MADVDLESQPTGNEVDVGPVCEELTHRPRENSGVCEKSLQAEVEDGYPWLMVSGECYRRA